VEQGGRTEDFVVLAGKLDVVEQGQSSSNTVHVHNGGSAIHYTGEPSYWNGTESVLGVGYANGTDKCFADGGFLDIYDSSTVLEGSWPPPPEHIVISITDFSAIDDLGYGDWADLVDTPIVVASGGGATVSLVGTGVWSSLGTGPFGSELEGFVEGGLYQLGNIVTMVLLRDIRDGTALDVFHADGGNLGRLTNYATGLGIGSTTWPPSLVPVGTPTPVRTCATIYFAVTPVAGYSGISVSGSGTGVVRSWGSWGVAVDVENTQTFESSEPFNALSIVTSISALNITLNPE